MRAVVLAAGRGERLKSIISNVPKPMVRVGDRPILEQNIVWLKDSGIRDIYVNLHHLADAIRDYFGDGSRWAVNIKYSYEPQLLGTAGAVHKIARDFWKARSLSTFVVIYGDNLLSSFDLAKIIRFHSAKGGLGTVCLYYKDDVSISGVAVLDDDGRISRFVEKPRPDQEISHLVNTGIYVLEPEILEYIPDGFSDFGRDIFPKVLETDKRLYGVVLNSKLVAIDTPDLFKQVADVRTK